MGLRQSTHSHEVHECILWQRLNLDIYLCRENNIACYYNRNETENRSGRSTKVSIFLLLFMESMKITLLPGRAKSRAILSFPFARVEQRQLPREGGVMSTILLGRRFEGENS